MVLTLERQAPEERICMAWGDYQMYLYSRLTVRKLLASKQDYPRAAQMRGDEGTAKIKLDIATDGSVAAVALVQPSGSAVLDREALALVRRVGAFPLPPGGSASLVVPLTWKMN